MQKLILILLAFFALFTFIHALEATNTEAAKTSVSIDKMIEIDISIDKSAETVEIIQ